MITVRENNVYAGGVKAGQCWTLVDGTIVRVEDVRLMATVRRVGDAASMLTVGVDTILAGRPVMERD